MPAKHGLPSNVEQGLQACNTTFGCFEVVAVSMLAMLAWAGFSAGLLFAPRANVRGALAAIGAECDSVIAERDALAHFADQLGELPTTQLQGTSVQGAGIGVASTTSRPPNDGMAAVENAYRETVMAVDHYEQDYGEPFAQHLATEFGEEIAGAVVANDQLTPQVKSALLTSAREGQHQREKYLEAMGRERERLQEADRLLGSIADTCESVDGNRLRRRPFEELQCRLDRLFEERERLTDALQERQERLHEGITFGWDRRDTESVYRFLYRDLDATYPVLADGTNLLERMRDVESRLTTAVTARL
ncbi:MAG: hypothetical protein V5A38_13495 [Halolamina sp.]|uniref:DUF7260 family protein n=1 Tax=Halolamina sp. TaxID=1940283 RepID=UPI002FC3388C